MWKLVLENQEGSRLQLGDHHMHRVICSTAPEAPETSYMRKKSGQIELHIIT